MNLLSKQTTFRNLFPAPEFLLLSTAGIAVTDADTKFVQLRREIWGDGFKMVNFKKIDNPKGAVESGLINNREDIVTILKNLSSQYHIRYAHVVLPEEKVYIFTAKIGWVPPEGQRDAVAFILEGNAPVSLSESVFDFEIISGDENTGEIKVAVCVLSENIVNAYIEIFESAGISPVSFDIESQAIVRAVVGHGDNLPYLVINSFTNKTGFYVVEEGVVQFSTTLSYGMGEDESYSSINDLKAEMRKVIAFWSSRTDKSGNLEKKIEKIILCGPGGSNKNFVLKLMSESEVPYSLANVCLNMSSSHSPASGLPPKESLEYASVLGLALPRYR